MKKKINVDLYGGKGLFGGKEHPLEADTIWCERSDECSFFKEKKCILCRSFMQPSRCPYGKVDTVKGYTSRAAKYSAFKKKYTEDPVYNSLKYPSNYVSVMGDTLYIYTSYVDVRKRDPSDEKWKRDVNGYIIGNCGFGCNYVFMPIQDATNELLHAVFTYSPTSMMGGRITAWKEKRVPEILQGMKKCVPEVYERFVAEYPEFKYEPNYIGKMAYIDSLKPGTAFKANNITYEYDGEYVSSVEEIDLGLGSPWWTQGGTKSKIRIKVNPKMTFEVTDNSIIDDEVRFV